MIQSFLVVTTYRLIGNIETVIFGTHNMSFNGIYAGCTSFRGINVSK